MVLDERDKIFPAESFAKQVLVSPEQYQTLYYESLQEPDKFWEKIASKEIDWFSPWNQVLDWRPPHCRWFVGGKLNITHNCLDRHAKSLRGNKIAFIHIDEKGTETLITYKELLDQGPCSLAPALALFIPWSLPV